MSRIFKFLALFCAVFLAFPAMAACTAPNGSYAGIIPGISFSSAGAITSAYLQMVSGTITCSNTSKTCTGTMNAKAVAVGDTSVKSGTITLSASQSSWNSTTCMGSFTANDTTSYFVSTSSGATLMLINPGKLSGSFEFMNGRLEKQ